VSLSADFKLKNLLKSSKVKGVAKSQVSLTVLARHRR